MKHTNCLHEDGEQCVFCEIAEARGAASKALATITGKMQEKRPTFERCADKTLEEVRAIYAQRGGEYADSWALENLKTPFLDSTLAMMGLKDVPPEVKRLLAMAALVDVKDSRLGGPWKLDSVVDGIAYRAAYATLREEYERG